MSGVKSTEPGCTASSRALVDGELAATGHGPECAAELSAISGTDFPQHRASAKLPTPCGARFATHCGRAGEFRQGSMPMTRSDKTPRRRSRATQDSNGAVTTVINFVAHTINRLRGKPDDAYINSHFEREDIVMRNPWRAVEVITGSSSCSASKGIKHKRFLCEQAPKLPLRGCTEIHCACHYKHHSDRRVGPRRAVESGVYVHLLSAKPINTERRHSGGRRSTDGV